MFTIQNDQGRTFNVRIVREGDRYGLDDCLTHSGAPMVEFYDASQGPKKFGERGQFVSRYHVDTLTGRDGFGSDIRNGYALALDGGVEAWTLDPCAAAQAVDWAASQVYA